MLEKAFVLEAKDGLGESVGDAVAQRETPLVIGSDLGSEKLAIPVEKNSRIRLIEQRLWKCVVEGNDGNA